MTKNLPGFTFSDADYHDGVDPEWVFDADPRFTIQDCTSYGGAFVVNEHSPEDNEVFWMKNHGEFPTSEEAAAQVQCLAAPDPLSPPGP